VPHVGITHASRTVHGRLVTLRLASRAMRNTQTVRVLLPTHYDRTGRTRYPVLYLLHGAGGTYRSWMDGDHVQRRLGDMPIITVMPNGSEPQPGAEPPIDGNYTDWWGVPSGSSATRPAWESFHILELVPYIDRHFPTLPHAAGRAVAGISMGGGGATKYAAEYPGTFGYAATFSGETNPLLPVALAFQPKTCRWGDPAREQVLWRDNDSTNLAGNLTGVRVFIRSGDGTPGPYDPPEPPGSVAALVQQARLTVEFGAHLESVAFLHALKAAHVKDVDARFFPGSHSDPYWQRDMAEMLPWLRRQLRHPPQTPPAFHVASAHRVFTAWGWRFAVHRSVREFAYLRIRGARLTATGSGRLDVVTPARFLPHRTYRVRIAGRTRRVRADRRGRLRYAVDLGPSHARQQTSFTADAIRRWRTATATVDR
jgi:S-formylglutathione hydrolase FrmB